MLAFQSRIDRIIAVGRNQQGVTLIELLIVLTMIGLITSAAFAVFSLGNQAFHRGELQSGIQNDLQRTGDFITAELRNASLVQIEGTVPEEGTFVPGRKYIYLAQETDAAGEEYTSVYFYYQGIATVKLDGAASLQEYDLVFKKVAGKNNQLYFKLTAQHKTQEYEFDTRLSLTNAESIGLAGGATAASGGMVISYTSDTNQIYYFQFTADGAGTPLSTAPAVIDGRTITAYIPSTFNYQTTKLVAQLATTGQGVTINGGAAVYSSEIPARLYALNTDIPISSVSRTGAKVEYKLIVKQAALMVKEAQIVNSSGRRILFCEKGSVLTGAYIFNTASFGPEGRSIREWWISSDNTNWRLLAANVRRSDTLPTYTIRPSYTGVDTSQQFYIKFRVIPVNQIGIQGDPVDYYYSTNLSGTELTVPNTVVVNSSLEGLMRSLVDQDGVLLRNNYEPDTALQFNNQGDISLLIRATRAIANGGSSLMMDLSNHVTDFNSYSIVVDAKINKPTSGNPGGYGILLNGDVVFNGDNLDTGYMLQFDPGANGFLIRRMNNGAHNPDAWYGMTTEGYPPASFTGTSLPSFGSNDWYKRYETEITVQIQEPNKDMVVRVRFRDQETGRYSRDMWFGNFGRIRMNDYSWPLYRLYNGADAGNSHYMRRITTQGNYFGIRSWTNGANADVEFYNLQTGGGFALYPKAEFVAQNKIKVTFSTDEAFSIDDHSSMVTAWFEADNLDLSKILLYPNSDPDRVIRPLTVTADNPVTRNNNSRQVSQTMILTLDPSLSIPNWSEMAADGGWGKITMSKGAVKQEYAGTVNIVCQEENIGKDVTEPIYSQTRNGRKDYYLTFTEPMKYDYTHAGDKAFNALDDPQNYTSSRSGDHPATVEVTSAQPWGPTQVHLYFSSNQNTSTDILAANTITDVAGNPAVPAEE